MHHRCWFFFVVVRRRREFRAISESGMFNVMPTENFKNFAVFGLSSSTLASNCELSFNCLENELEFSLVICCGITEK